MRALISVILYLYKCHFTPSPRPSPSRERGSGSPPLRGGGLGWGLVYLCGYVVIILLGACQRQPQPQVALIPHVQVLAEGLSNPVGLALLPDGGLLIAEEGTGEGDNSAGVSLLTSEGEMGRLISGLPSSRDSGDLSGVPLVAVSPDDSTIFVGSFNQGHLWTLPVSEGVVLPERPFTTNDLTPRMMPLNRVQLINPFDMTFDVAGVPVVSDASTNGVAKEKTDGTTTFFHQFFELKDPANEKITLDPVPTGITRVGEEYYVTLTGGCPYPADSGRLVAIDESRNERVVLDGLNMPIDVAQGADGTLWLLEFARYFSENPFAHCFTGEGYQPNSGRLSRINDKGELEVVLDGLDFPGAVLPMADGRLLISEVFAGRVLQVSFGEEAVSVETAVLAPEAARPLWQFTNVAEAEGLDFQHGVFHTGLYEDPVAMMGAGLCWLDYDKDGWLDLYLVNSFAQAENAYWRAAGHWPQNSLFRNKRGQFEAVGQESGTNLSMRGNGCVAADFDLDGWTDIYVTADGPNALLWNNGDGTFSEGAMAANAAAPEWNSAAVVGDVNGDGWPDLFVASYINLENKIPNPSGAFPQDFYGLADHLYLGGEGRQFVEVTAVAGLVREERGLGALLTDVDNDGDLDLYIANDGHRNRLYENQPAANALGFHFVDLSDSADAGDAGSGMGVAGGDYDGDGYLDLFVTNWEPELNALYRNRTEEQGEINFVYSTFRIGFQGLGRDMTGWGTHWADFDQDGDEDLLFVNGRVPVTNFETDPELIRLFGNQLVEGQPGQLRQWTEARGLETVGPLLARGSAVADFDNDGDLDVAINTIAGKPALLRNDFPAGNWLMVELSGFWPGTVVEVVLPDGRSLIREGHVGSSYLASEDPRLHFGVGGVMQVDVVVRWPDGRRTELRDVSVNQHLLVSPTQ